MQFQPGGAAITSMLYRKYIHLPSVVTGKTPKPPPDPVAPGKWLLQTAIPCMKSPLSVCL